MPDPIANTGRDELLVVYRLLDRANPDCCFWHRFWWRVKCCSCSLNWMRILGPAGARELAILVSAKLLEIQQCDDPIEKQRIGGATLDEIFERFGI